MYMDETLNKILDKLEQIEKKIDKIDSKIEMTFHQVVRNSEELSEVKDRMKYINRRVSDVELEFQSMKGNNS